MKNEVRFKDKDLLNSFLIKSIKSSLVTLGYKNSNKSSFELINKFQSKNNFQKNLILKENSEIENRAYTEVKTNEKKSLDYFPLGFAKSQFHENYIISQTKDGIIIIDQHAAHERIIYEKLKEDFYNKKIKTQILLIPIIINVDNIILNSLKKVFKFREVWFENRTIWFRLIDIKRNSSNYSGE